MTTDNEPKTQAGRALLDVTNEWGNIEISREYLRETVLAIEAEAQILRPRWHHDKTLSPEDRKYCEDCAELERRAEAAAAPVDIERLRRALMSTNYGLPLHRRDRDTAYGRAHRIAKAYDSDRS